MRPVLTRGSTTSTPRWRSSASNGAVSISDRVETKPATVRALRTSGNAKKCSAACAAIDTRRSAGRPSRSSAMARRRARFSSLSESSAESMAANASFLLRVGRPAHGTAAPPSGRCAHQERGRCLAGRWLKNRASMWSIARRPDEAGREDALFALYPKTVLPNQPANRLPCWAASNGAAFPRHAQRPVQ